MSYFKRDFWMVPFSVTSSTNKLRVIEAGPSNIDITITANDYFGHAAGSLSSTRWRGFFDAVITALNAASSETYSIESSTPTDSTEQLFGGVRLKSTAAFTIDWSDTTNNTVDPRWFGFTRDDASLAAVDIDSDGNFEMDSRLSVYTWWRSDSLFPLSGVASSKRGYPVREINYSHDRPADRWALEWYTDTIRPISYEQVPASHVFEDAGGLSEFTDYARLAEGDSHNAFETVWSALSRNEVALIVHNVGDAQLDLDITNHDTEAVKLLNERDAQDLMRVVRLLRTAGEVYRIDLSLYVVEDSNLPGYAF